jgi:hypothetical protein
MGQRNVRVVVGQGDPERQGFLRTVLEDDGLDVVGEAGTTSHLARLLTDERPDVVVLDDSIGVAAVQVTAEIVPSAKIVVVWPSAVMPIAGAIRVEPSDVLSTLAGTVALAAGVGGLGGIDRPEWIEKIRKDPTTLREMLAARGGVPTRPSVTELQRRGNRLHPAPRRSARPKAKPGEKPADKDRGAVVTPIPLASASAGPRSRPAPRPAPREESWNRRLGIIALGGAAVASALTVALAFSNRAPSFTAAEPFIPPIVQPSQGPVVPPNGNGSGNPDGNNGNPDGNNGPPGGNTNAGANGSSGGAGGGTTTIVGFGGTDIRGMLGGPLPSPDRHGGNDSDGENPSDEFPGSQRNSAHLPGSRGNGNPGGPSTTGGPGESDSKNPHGGPPGLQNRPEHPGQSSNACAQGGGQSSHAGGRSASHANKHAHKQ